MKALCYSSNCEARCEAVNSHLVCGSKLQLLRIRLNVTR
jgi:hypothetical protein